MPIMCPRVGRRLTARRPAVSAGGYEDEGMRGSATYEHVMLPLILKASVAQCDCATT